MITAQDIREKTFAKTTFSGYDMGEVDDFLEELAAGLTAAQKENGMLKGKMKVLVDKIEEYRATEDAMNKALVSAQQVAQKIEAEAQEKADAVLAGAQAQAEAILAEANAQAKEICGDVITKRETEERRLAAAQEASAKYLEKMLLVCRKQTDFLTALQEMEAVPAAEEEAVYEEAYEPAAEEPAWEAPAEEPVYEEAGEGIPEVDEDVDEPTRMFRF